MQTIRTKSVFAYAQTNQSKYFQLSRFPGIYILYPKKGMYSDQIARMRRLIRVFPISYVVMHYFRRHISICYLSVRIISLDNVFFCVCNF